MKKKLAVEIGILIVLSFMLVLIFKDAEARTEQHIVDRICGRAEVLMVGYQHASLDRQIETDEAASACGIVKSVTQRDYRGMK